MLSHCILSVVIYNIGQNGTASLLITLELKRSGEESINQKKKVVT